MQANLICNDCDESFHEYGEFKIHKRLHTPETEAKESGEVDNGKLGQRESENQ